MKKILALICAASLTVLCAAGCSDSAQTAASSDTSSAASEEAAASQEAVEAAAPDLNTEHAINGLSYKVSSTWTETDAGTMAAYSGEAAEDLPFTISVAALDPELVLAAESSDAEPNGALLSLLGVDSSSLEPTEFKGQSAVSFTGEAESAYQASGYTIREDDGTMFVLMIQSTNVSDPLIAEIWQAFQDTVEVPAA